ncbi:MAG: hypothetical protein PHW82_08925 [Bacteroidales bacterium]|nr:hypothetical protein [Bacteroidales bacterium]
MTLKDIIKSYFQTGKKPTQQQFAALIDACYNTPIFHNVIHVNYQLIEDNPSAFVFKTYAAAVSWIQANGTPALSNTWTIMLPSGNVAEDITVYANIRVELMAGTVVTGAIYSDVSSAAESIAYLTGGRLNNLIVGTGKSLILNSCFITGDQLFSGEVTLFKSTSLKPIDFSAGKITAYDSHFINNTLTLPYKFGNADIYGGSIKFSQFSGNSTLDAVILDNTTIIQGNTTANNCSFKNNTVIINKSKLSTIACFVHGIDNKDGDWQNTGCSFNNQSTALNSTNMQSVVIELKNYIDSEIEELAKLIK